MLLFCLFRRNSSEDWFRVLVLEYFYNQLTQYQETSAENNVVDLMGVDDEVHEGCGKLRVDWFWVEFGYFKQFLKHQVYEINDLFDEWFILVFGDTFFQVTDTTPNHNHQLLLPIIGDADDTPQQVYQPNKERLLKFKLPIVFHNLVISFDEQVLDWALR